MRLSVLDLVPVRTDQTTGDALAATVQLAQTADRLGFTRYWVAEHHNMPSVGATSPPVLIAYLAAQTTQLRLGSGGVMLPNHAPLAVAASASRVVWSVRTGTRSRTESRTMASTPRAVRTFPGDARGGFGCELTALGVSSRL